MAHSLKKAKTKPKRTSEQIYEDAKKNGTL